MDKAVMEEWVAALRSGKYRQGQSMLRVFDSEQEPPMNRFCCLGVLCDIFSETRTDCSWASCGSCDAFAFGVKGQDFNCKALPDAVRHWADMRSKVGYLYNPESGNQLEDEYSLVYLNDAGCTFKQLADWIERNYEKL